MNNSKIYKILYYLCFILNIFIYIILINKNSLLAGSISSLSLGIINLVLVLVFSILLIKKKKTINTNILFPILFLIFFVIVMIIMFMFNGVLFIPFMHFNYYIFFIEFNYLLLNVYSLLSISK